jgi:peptidoglycan/xylan/chitin deacetylase (PgdA/CDA1 family)
MRRQVKHAAEVALDRSRIAWLVCHRARRQGLILAYHNIVPAGCVPIGDRSLHLPEAAFEQQLDVLERHAEVRPLEDLVRPDRPTSSKPEVAITFDDAYRGAVTAGVAALARRGFPSTLFVPPAFVGGASFWWDVLAGPDGKLADLVRSTVLGSLQGEDAAARRWAAGRGIPMTEPPDHARGASEAELAAAATRGAVTFGSHSWSHANLASLDTARLGQELTASRDWLAGRFGDRFVPWLSFPYGSYSESVPAELARAGYRGALRIDGGRLSSATTPLAWPRLNVPAGLSVEGFSLRLAGLPLG